MSNKQMIAMIYTDHRAIDPTPAHGPTIVLKITATGGALLELLDGSGNPVSPRMIGVKDTQTLQIIGKIESICIKE